MEKERSSGVYEYVRVWKQVQCRSKVKNRGVERGGGQEESGEEKEKCTSAGACLECEHGVCNKRRGGAR